MEKNYKSPKVTVLSMEPECSVCLGTSVAEPSFGPGGEPPFL